MTKMRRSVSWMPRGHQMAGPLGILLVSALLTGCAASPTPMRPAVQAMVTQRDALAIADDLERLIDDQSDNAEDREAAYEAVLSLEEDTASYAFARAAVTGRLAQIRSLSALGLVREMERYALRSLALDPDFRDGATKRMLGTLYVMAPSILLAEGNAAKGLELLTELVRDQPNRAENHLRLAQGYVESGEPDLAARYLCRAAELQQTLRPADLRLMDELMGETAQTVNAACVTSNTTAF
jgi:tetratricopeptide (TPR) repeat protein